MLGPYGDTSGFYRKEVGLQNPTPPSESIPWCGLPSFAQKEYEIISTFIPETMHTFAALDPDSDEALEVIILESANDIERETLERAFAARRETTIATNEELPEWLASFIHICFYAGAFFIILISFWIMML